MRDCMASTIIWLACGTFVLAIVLGLVIGFGHS